MTTVRLYPSTAGALVDPCLYGHFAEHLGTCIYEGLWVGEDSPIPNTNGFRNDVVTALRRLRPPVLRWPGGCFADYYFWEDGIGPRESRPTRINVWWGEVLETNAVGTHEFMELCRQLGAQPYLCGNLGSGSPKEMAQWLEYCNFAGDSSLARRRRANGAAEPFGVTYWGVGNENWGCGGNLDPEDYAVEYRRFATYLRDFSGHPVYLIACGPNGNNIDWTHRFMAKLQRGRARLHGYAAHYYCGTTGRSAVDFTPVDGLSLVERAETTMETLVKQQRAALDGFDADRRVQLIIDEWGTWHAPDPAHPARSLWQQNTMRDALVAGASLDVFVRHADKVRMTNIAQTVNVLQAMCLTAGDRMLLTPTYHVYAMHLPHQGARRVVLGLESESIAWLDGERDRTMPAVNGAASLREGQLTVTLTCRRPDAPEPVCLRLADATATTASVTVLAADEMTAHNTFDEPDLVAPRPAACRVDGNEVYVELPPYSVAVVSITLE